MVVSRRSVLRAGTGIALTGLAAACGSGQNPGSPGQGEPAPDARTDLPDDNSGLATDVWDSIRSDFNLDTDFIHMSAMLLASHPAPVRNAIEEHRNGLDRNPVIYLEEHMRPGMSAAREAIATYLGTRTDRIALTNSTTNAVGITYNGLVLAPGDEVLTTEQDYYVTFEALRQMTSRYGAIVRTVPLYDRPPTLTEEEAVARILSGVSNATRLVALTWVHSSTGYKLPVRAVTSAIADLNASRPASRQILVGIDGVHGFGVEDFELSDLGCDFFMSGCHKWLFGPRGTGFIAAGSKGYEMLVPSVPSFIENGGAFDAWILDDDEVRDNNAERMTPGGFQAFEHKLAVPAAVAWQMEIGKAAVADRTHALASQLKEGLASIPGVTVHTPLDRAFSAGIVSFDIEGQSARETVERLRHHRIIASAAPYAVPHARLTPSIRNSPSEIEAILRRVREIA